MHQSYQSGTLYVPSDLVYMPQLIPAKQSLLVKQILNYIHTSIVHGIMEHLYFYQNTNSLGQFGLWVRKQQYMNRYLLKKKVWAGKQGDKTNLFGHHFINKGWNFLKSCRLLFIIKTSNRYQYMELNCLFVYITAQ